MVGPMFWLLALALAAQTGTEQPAPYIAPPKLPGGFSHVGAYMPSTQLLEWCKSQDVTEVRSCDSYIAGVVEAAGMIDVDFPRGPIDTGQGDYVKRMFDMRFRVIAYIEAMPRSNMTDPASRSVYDALIGKYFYQGSHKTELPYRQDRSGRKPAVDPSSGMTAKFE